MKRLRNLATLTIISLLVSLQSSCDPIPPLHLHEGRDIDSRFPLVEISLDVLWNYNLLYEIGYDSIYDWRKEWKYGWDKQDSLIFGPIGYTSPRSFNLRRYFLGNDTLSPRKSVLRDHIDGYTFRSNYNFGYYDFLIWNDVITSDEVESIIIDEESTLDSVTVATSPTNYGVRYMPAPQRQYSYNQPDELFAVEENNILISDRLEDYDYYDEAAHIYYKYLDLTLYPVVYIYLTQVILHRNFGKVVGTDGNASLSNMSYSACLNSGRAGVEDVTVHYNNRLKQNVRIRETGEVVDIIGGRLTTFGIREINPFHYANVRQIPECIRKQRHYLDVNMVFGNGYDTTLVFDVTDQVVRRYRGGVITIELDMDSIRSPNSKGGWGFNAVVEDFEEETHEFDVIK